ncbi:MAG TPA: cellulase family glycosylhydrolase [Solirubrobacteraceae bacterium]|nr:cellulase family glycosylhydrolase [Solirubrobacteraceae bacterium]
MRRISIGWTLCVIIVVGLVAAGAAVALSLRGGRGAHVASAPGLHVVGNRILNQAGQQVLLQGVNRSGTEYACIQGWGIFDGPSDASSVAAMATWHINIVRIPVNEDCWLGINGVKPQYGGANYRNAIISYVQLLHQYGMYAEISLMWGAPAGFPAEYQPSAPDEDHSPAVWAGMAQAFKDDPNVILAPWGESVVSADCFLKGGCTTFWGPQHTPYRAAGMQQAVKVMRAAGYDGIIAIPGLAYSNDLTDWLSHEPRDPRHQLIAEAHVYGGNYCDNVKCFQATYAPVARRVPLIFGETGENFNNKDCSTRYITTIVKWADAHDVGLEAWAWDTWRSCGILIRNYAGKPFSAYGAFIRDHYLARQPRLLARPPS